MIMNVFKKLISELLSQIFSISAENIHNIQRQLI